MSSQSLKQLTPLGVDPLPIRALRLDPVTAETARVARGPAFGNDTLKPKLVAMIEQHFSVWERLHRLRNGVCDCRHNRVRSRLKAKLGGDLCPGLRGLPSWRGR